MIVALAGNILSIRFLIITLWAMVISEWICVNCCCFFSSLFYHRTDCLSTSVKCFAGYLPSQLLFYRQDIFEGFIGFHAVAGGRKIFGELYQNVRHARSVQAIVSSSISTFVACSCFRQRYRNSRPLPGRREMFGENLILSKWKPVVQRHRFLLNIYPVSKTNESMYWNPFELQPALEKGGRLCF